MKTISISQWVAAVNRVTASRQSAAYCSRNWRRSPESPLRAGFLALALFVLFTAFTTFAQINLPIGNLAPGETVTLTFDVTPTNPFPAGVTAITNQGTLTGSNFSSVNSDDPQTVPAGDPTITLVEVPIPPPQLINPTKTNNGPFQFTFTSTAGQTFTVLASTNVVLPVTNWTVLGPATEVPAGQFKFSDPQAITNSLRFYRVRWP